MTMCVCIRLLVLEHCWNISSGSSFPTPPYSPDLTPSYHRLFAYLKNWLRSLCFSNNDLKEGVKKWLSSQAADFFDTGIQELIPRYDKGLNFIGDCNEK
jgi:transposase